MRAKNCVLITIEFRAWICRWYNAFRPLIAQAAVHSQAVVLLLLIHCLMLFPLIGCGFCDLFCYASLSALSSFAIIWKRERGVVALLLLSS